MPDVKPPNKILPAFCDTIGQQFREGKDLANDKAELIREQKRVDIVLKTIKKRIEKTEQMLADAHQETRAVEKNYGENASINRYEVDDIAESRAMIEQQRRLVNQAVENETILKRQLKTLKQLQASPYFGRIDIQDPGEDEAESLYIGTASLMNEDETDFLIYDWRAPISAVYYNGTLGPCSYQTPSGQRQTTLVKKRQFTIQHGKITHMFDTNELVGDEMLQQALSEHDDRQMHNIVATIQHEQNDIIRDTKSDLLLVQGVAGSGKTSAILQRIAYLLYHSRESLNADQIVLFSPNLLFSRYIADVLPSLGERNMRQVTLAGFLSKRFEGLTVESLFDRYEKRRTSHAEHPVADWLEQPAMMKAVRDYLQELHAGQHQLCFTALNFNGSEFFSAQHIKDIFAQQPTAMSIVNRLVRTKNVLIRELQHRVTVEARSKWIAAEMDDLTTLQLHRLYGKHSPQDFEDEKAAQRYLARRYTKNRLRPVAEAIYNNYFLDMYEQYHNLLSHITVPAKISQREWTSMILQYSQQLEYHQLALMHAAPLLYLRDLITGGGQNRALQYVFIDEMQDYSPAMLIYLHHAFPMARFTILGDSEQALFNPLELPETLLQNLGNALGAEHSNLIVLRRAYRSTTEITDFAKALLPDGQRVISFTRHGTKPRLLTSDGDQQSRALLANEVRRLANGQQTVAVLTIDDKQAHTITRLLHQAGIDAKRLSTQDSELPSEVAVLPIYLAKGLEFDAVLIPDVSATAMPDQSFTGILYTMASRAMHELTMISNGPVTPLINDAVCQHLKIEAQISPRD